jgi:MSHA biogenesis protein MshM
MYLAHYGLSQSPFSITPNPEFFYSGNQRGAILEALSYAVIHGEGIVKVTGEVGSGKTMLCRMLESMLPDNIEVIYLVNPTLSREEVGFAIAGELGLPAEGKRADEVIRLLHSDLIAKHGAGKQVVLLVEEAQAMPLDTLEEIRLFSNLETSRHKLLQIVLFGQPELDENLALPRMRQLKERITHSFKGPALTPALLPEFLMFRMRAAGYRGANVFTQGAIAQIAAVSEGIVRRVSILADKALLAAFAENAHDVTVKHVKAAMLDSQFSPSAGKRRRRALALGAALALIVSAAITWALLRQPVPPSLVDAEAQSATRAVAAQARLLQRAHAWLDGQAGSHFTLQLLLADPDPRQAARQLSKFDEEIGLDNVQMFPTTVAGQTRYGVLYAIFSTRAAALAMKRQLAQEWGYEPQLRSIAGIREEIRRTNSAVRWPN